MKGKKKITAGILLQWSGLFAILSGVIYITIQFIHPADNLSSVNTNIWLIVA